jgi:predicted SAM-dependent methyltransferase
MNRGLLPLRVRIAVKRVRNRPLLVILGAGDDSYPGWLSTDIHTLDLLERGSWVRLFKPESIDALLAEHVWEHLTEEEGRRAARNCYEFIRPGGRLRVAVPDGMHPLPSYVRDVQPGGAGAGAKDHKVLYSYATFGALFDECGFSVDLLEYFDGDGNFHGKDWQPEEGMVKRSRRFDERNAYQDLSYTSLILDATKPFGSGEKSS